MDLTQSSVKLFAGRTAGAVIQFLGVVYFARELGAAVIGVFFLFQAMVEIISIPTDLGLRGAVEKRISEGHSRGEHLLATVVLKGSIFALVVPILLVFRGQINTYLGGELTIFLVVSILLQETLRLSVFSLKGELRVGETAVIMLSQKILWVLGGVLLVHLGLQAKALVLSLMLSFGVPAAWGWKKLSVTPRRPSREHFRSILDYGKYSAISSLGDVFYNWIDLAIIGLFLTQTDVGAYEIAWRVSAIVMLLSSSIATTILPQVSRWSTEGEIERIESVVREAVIPSMFLTIPSFLGVVLLSEEILTLIFSAEFGFASLALIILMSEKILFSAHIIFKQVLMGVDRPDLAAYSILMSAAINIVLNFALVPRYGIVGAASATALSFTFNTVAHVYYLNKIIDIEFPFTEIGWCWVSATVMVLGLLGLERFVSVSSIHTLLFYVGGGALIYVLVSLLFPSLRRKMVNQMYKLRPS